MIRIEHSLFALPFAYIGMVLAARGWPGFAVFLPLSVAMVAIRSFAMSFNRIVDVEIDRQNPRTQGRHLVSGAISMRAAALFCLGTAAIFVLSCFLLNSLCLMLTPVALAIGAGYSFTKRFTWLSHFVLGLVLGMAPVAGWIAVTPQIEPVPVLFLCAVMFWTAGFDIIYATQDVDFDRARGLHSIPARFGVEEGLRLAAFCHVVTVFFALFAGWISGLGWPWYLAWGLTCALLFAEHKINSPHDLKRLNAAFFVVNALVSSVYLAGVILGLYF